MVTQVRTFNLRQAPILQFAEYLSADSAEWKHHEFCEFLDELDCGEGNVQSSEDYKKLFTQLELTAFAELVNIAKSVVTLKSGSKESLCTQRDVLAKSIKFIEASLIECERQIAHHPEV